MRDLLSVLKPMHSMALPGPGAGRGSVGTMWRTTGWSPPTAERGLSGDRAASLMWARLLHTLERPESSPAREWSSVTGQKGTVLAGQQPSPHPWSTRDSPALIIKDEDLTLLRMLSQ